MKKVLGLVVLGGALVGLAACGSGGGGNSSMTGGVFGEPTIAVCQPPASDPSGGVTLLVAESEVDKYLAQGATLGSCPGIEPPAGQNPPGVDPSIDDETDDETDDLP